MRNFFTFCFAATALWACAIEYITPGNGAIITPASLASITQSGVTDEGEGVYCFANDVNVAAADVFSIAGAKVLKLKDGVVITVNGKSDFEAPSDARLTVTRASETDFPSGIRMLNETSTPASFKNIDFEYAGLHNFSTTGFDIDNCTFTACNGKLSSIAALALGSTDADFNISYCSFTDCTVPAIGGGANAYCGINITGCTFVNNNTQNTNKPQINITVGGDRQVTIRNCKIQGAGLNKVGGIAVGNLLNKTGDNKVIIENCEITEHRYGITGVGAMNIEIRNNMLVGNNHETNAMNGGSGISLSGYGYGLNSTISGNRIERSLWGVTLIQCADVNLGQVGNADSPGGNVFKDNANGGTPYDLYNNGTTTVYAQLNTWSVPEQTAEEIEKVIFHKTDDARLGEVIYMPAADPAGIADVVSDAEAAPATWFDLLGRPVENPGHGTYIRVQGAKVTKELK